MGWDLSLWTHGSNPAGTEFPSEVSAGEGIMSLLRVSVAAAQFLDIVA